MKSWNGLDGAAASPAVSLQPRRTQVRWRALAATVLTTSVLTLPELINWSARVFDHSSRFGGWKPAEKPFQWSEITAKEHLEFHKCFDGFECAKLSLPLDYFNGTYPDKTVSIAIAKLPARVPVDDPRYGGPILLNPGGPGGPGALFALLAANQLQTIVDSGIDPNSISSDAKYFDLIGFDPRGIGETEPVAECLPDEPSSWSWTLRENNEGILGSSDATLGRLWSMTHAYGTSCKQAADAQEGPDIKEYLSTAFVARDMLEIVEKHAEYVAKKVAELSGPRRTGPRSRCHEAYTPGKAKLQYWGFSYGTYLGSTFASMFPDRVGRLILDGVVSSYDYNHALGNGSLVDTEKSMKSFYNYCQDTKGCPLATANGTVKDIEERFHKIVNSLYHNPLPINSPQGPEVLTYSDLKLFIFSTTYQPRLTFGFLAQLLAAIEVGGGEILEELSFAYRSGHIYHCPANASDQTPKGFPNVAEYAILCGDGLDQSHVGVDEFVDYWNLLETISPTAGAIWAMLKMRCAAWKFKSQYTFQGPFGGNTSHPILFVSNTADPVTPLRSGRFMHSLFPNSGIVISDSAGHCSVSTVNPCIFTQIRKYFQTGVLPPPGTVCAPPPSPFSLNSTDPKSPFYDPSLGSTNTILLNVDRCDAQMQDLQRASSDLQQLVSESDAFGFQNMFGGHRLRNLMKTATQGYY